MKFTLWVGIFLALTLAGCVQEAAKEGAISQATPSTEGLSAETVPVEISRFAFQPGEIRIKKGSTVVWTNQDPVQHTVTSDSGPELDSPLLAKNNQFRHTFNTLGVFEYHCQPHPYMKGRIIVE